MPCAKQKQLFLLKITPRMKRISTVLFFAFLLNGCDDGDLIFDELDFDDVNVARCSDIANNVPSNILYKLNDTEALILQIDNLETALPDAPTPQGVPVSINIDGANVRVVYRLYSANAGVDNICESIQPPTPVVTEEWNATAGTINITTTAIVQANTAAGYEGGEVIDKLRHGIVLKNVTFQTPNNQIIYETFAFGNYDVEFDAPSLSIGGTPALCDLDDTAYAYDLLYRFNATTALTINIDPALLDVSVLNTPKTGVISGEMNRVTYNRFENVDLSAMPDFCATYLGLTPAATWTSVDGEAGLSGIVEVTTTTFGSGFQHTIRLKNVRMQNAGGTLSFKIADDLLYGELIQN